MVTLANNTELKNGAINITFKTMKNFINYAKHAKTIFSRKDLRKAQVKSSIVLGYNL